MAKKAAKKSLKASGPARKSVVPKKAPRKVAPKAKAASGKRKGGDLGALLAGARTRLWPWLLTTLVFQIDSKKSVPFMFGDMGRGHVTQCPEHKDVLAFGWACS